MRCSGGAENGKETLRLLLTSCQRPRSISELWSVFLLNFLQPHSFLGLSWEHEFI